MGLVGGFWMVQLGVLALLERLGSHTYAEDGTTIVKRNVGAIVWSVIAFVVGGISAFWGAWTTLHSVISVGWLAKFPLYWVTYLCVALIQLGLGVLVVISGVFKITGRPPFMRKGVMILGIAAVIAGVWLAVAGFVLV